jgi:L-cysteine desulfidase
MLRAVTLSNLIAIYIKSKFGRLSALCGATVAGTGAACGITYLLGGGLAEVSYAVQNMIGNVTGMLCDGAKPIVRLKFPPAPTRRCRLRSWPARGNLSAVPTALSKAT